MAVVKGRGGNTAAPRQPSALHAGRGSFPPSTPARPSSLPREAGVNLRLLGRRCTSQKWSLSRPSLQPLCDGPEKGKTDTEPQAQSDEGRPAEGDGGGWGKDARGRRWDRVRFRSPW